MTVAVKGAGTMALKVAMAVTSSTPGVRWLP
jgi:hypothetical protein